MKKLISVLWNQGMQHWEARKDYRTLARHLNSMPVGFPRTMSGVERRILRAVFTPMEARAALNLGYKPEPAQAILDRAEKKGVSRREMEKHLSSLEKKGALLVKQVEGQWRYCLLPFVVGFFETQVSAMSPGFYLDTTQYMSEAMGMEYLMSDPQQLRIVPVEKSLTPKHNISTHDEIRKVIKGAGKSIALAPCICRKGRDMVGAPCLKTDRRETCLAFHDFGEMYIRNGWARRISAQEALDIVAQSEKEGLVIELSNERDPSFACMCCSCCCGIFTMLAAVPRPVDFVQSNFHAELDLQKCTGCGKCEKRCPTQAIVVKDKIPALDPARCIGCGLCAAGCKPGAVYLTANQRQKTPPETYEALMEAIMANKPGLPGKMVKAAKGALGMKLR